MLSDGAGRVCKLSAVFPLQGDGKTGNADSRDEQCRRHYFEHGSTALHGVVCRCDAVQIYRRVERGRR